MAKKCDLRKLWKSDYFKTIVTIVLIVAIIAGFFFGHATCSGNFYSSKGCGKWQHVRFLWRDM